MDGLTIGNDEIGRTAVASGGRVARTWYGVPLKIGNNEIVATAQDGALRATVQVQVCGPVANIALRGSPAIAPADGRSVIHLAGKLLDGAGLLVRQSGMATLKASAGAFVGEDADLAQSGFQVPVRDGCFVAALQTGHVSQHVLVQAYFAGVSGETTVRFSTELRPMIGAGVVDLHLGRAGSDFFQGFDQLLDRDFGSGKTLRTDTAAFFTGSVLRDWQLTTAYNSRENLNQNDSGTPGLAEAPQFEEQQYPVYGDSSQVTDLAPSSDHLYARLERGDDYALWGSYGTQEFSGPSQQISGLSRQLQAFKTHLQSGPVQLTAFYGDNAEQFARDTITPDGTRGDYFLSQRPVLVGSETISIEEIDADFPGRVVSAATLTRGTDYEIDYDRGTLLFAEPVLRTDVGADDRLLLRQIVATYQKDTQAAGTSSVASGGGVYGGRLQMNLGGAATAARTLGVTTIFENQGERRFALNGADCRLPFAGAGTITAEIAHSQADGSEGSLRGSAYRFNFDGAANKKITSHVYLQRTDSGFVNNATLSFVPGQLSYGGDVSARVSQATRWFAGYDAQHTDASSAQDDPLDFLGELGSSSTDPTQAATASVSDRSTYAGLEEAIDHATLTTRLISRERSEDAVSASESGGEVAQAADTGSSGQVQTTLLDPLTRKITLQALNIATLSGIADPQYSDRTAIGVSLNLNADAALRLSETHYAQGAYAGRNVLSLDSIVKRKIDSDFNVQQRVSVISGLGGVQVESSTGCNRDWQIARGFSAKATYERISASDALSGYADPLASASATPAQAGEYSLLTGSSTSASGSLDYSALRNVKISLGIDDRSSSQGNNTVVSALIDGKLSNALTALARYEKADSANGSVAGLGDDSSLRVGLAYRDPSDDRFNALLHYDLRSQSNDGLLADLSAGADRTSLFAAEAIYAPDWRWEFYGKLASRSSTSQIDEGISAGSTLMLSQERVTRYLTGRIDIAAELRQINQAGGLYRASGGLVEAGYALTPNLRLAAGYSIGRIRDTDFQGAAQNGGAYVGVTVKLGSSGL